MRDPAWRAQGFAVAEIMVLNLMSDEPRVANAAHAGLRSLKIAETLPQGELERVLRLALDLGDFAKATEARLRGLRSLLQVVPPSNFNDRLGDKLCEHLQRCTASIVAQMSSSAPMWLDGSTVHKAQAIIAVLAELGDMASRLVGRVLRAVMDAEASMGRHAASPFADPMCHLLCRFPEEATAELLPRVSSPSHLGVLLAALRHEDASRLRDAVAARVGQLIANIRGGLAELEAARNLGEQVQRSELPFRSAAVVHALMAGCPTLLRDNPELLKLLDMLWKYSLVWDRKSPDVMPASRSGEPRMLLDTFLMHLRQFPQQADLLLSVLQALEHRTLVDVGALRSFLLIEAPLTYPVTCAREVLLRLVALLPDAAVSQEAKAAALEKVAVPMLYAAVHAGQATELLGAQPDQPGSALLVRLMAVLRDEPVGSSASSSRSSRTATTADTAPSTVDKTAASATEMTRSAGQGVASTSASGATPVDGTAAVVTPATTTANTPATESGAVGGTGTAGSTTRHTTDAASHTTPSKPALTTVAYSDTLRMAVLEVVVAVLRLAKEWPAVARAVQPVQRELVTFLYRRAFRGEQGWGRGDPLVAHAGALALALAIEPLGFGDDAQLSELCAALLEDTPLEPQQLARQAIDTLVPHLLARHAEALDAAAASSKMDTTDDVVTAPVAVAAPSVTSGSSEQGTTTAAASESDTSASVASVPAWLDVLRNLLLGDNQQLIQHAWAVVVRHADGFYPLRATLFPLLTLSLPRVSLQTADTRRAHVDVCAVVIAWDQRAGKEAVARGDAKRAEVAAAAAAEIVASNATHTGTSTNQALSSLSDPTGLSPQAAGAAAAAAVPRASQRCREIVINVLVLAASQAADKSGVGGTGDMLAHRCLKLLNSVVKEGMWADVPVPVTRFEKVLSAPITASNETIVAGNQFYMLRVLVLLVRRQKISQWLKMLVQLRNGLRPVATVAQPRVSRAFTELIENVLEQVGRAVSNNRETIIKMLEPLTDAIEAGLTQALALPASKEQPLAYAQLRHSLGLLHLFAAAKVRLGKTEVVHLLAPLVKIMQRAQKDHLAETAANPVQDAYGNGTGAATPAGDADMDRTRGSGGGGSGETNSGGDVSSTTTTSDGGNAAGSATSGGTSLAKGHGKKGESSSRNSSGELPVPSAMSRHEHLGNVEAVVLLCLELLAPHIKIMDANEQRRQFITSLQALLERSRQPEILQAAVRHLGQWALSPDMEGVLSGKERGQLLAKAQTTCIKRMGKHRATAACFLEMVCKVFETKRVLNTDLTQRLEAGFMAGLRSAEFATREHFFRLFDRPNESATLFERLDYCFSDKCQRWDTSRQHFWVKHCLDIVLAGALQQMPLRQSSRTLAFAAPRVLDVEATSLKAVVDNAAAQVASAAATQQAQQAVDGSANSDDPQSNTASSTNGSQSEASRAARVARAALAQLQPVLLLQADPRLAPTPAAQPVLTRQEHFLSGLRDMTAGDLVLALRTMCSLSAQLAYDMWVEVFPLVWQLLDPGETQALTPSLQCLLQQDYLQDQALLRPSNVHALVTGIAHCGNAGPVLSVQLLHHLATTHNLWHTATAMIVQQEARSAARPTAVKPQAGKPDPLKDALADLYQRLNEPDTWYGQWRLRGKLPETTRALAWEQQGNWEEAQQGFERIVQQTQQQGAALREAEFKLWEEHWIQCSERLGQHDLLYKFAEDTKNQELMADTAWKLRKWKHARDAVARLEQQRDAHWRLRILKAYTLVSSAAEDFDAAAVTRLCDEAGQLALQEWMTLPTTVCAAHVPLLQAFQALVELHESSQLLLALNPAAAASGGLAGGGANASGNALSASLGGQGVPGTPSTAGNGPGSGPGNGAAALALPGAFGRPRLAVQDVSNTLDAWRHRMPCQWDEIEVWDSLLLWRLHVFERLGTLPQSTEVAFGDLARTLNHLARIARHHRMRGVCQRRLQQMASVGTMSMADNFRRVHEMFKCEMTLRPDDRAAQLELMNSTNLSHFAPKQIAQLLSMKASVLAGMGHLGDANQLFASAVAQCEDVSAAWEAWFFFCNERHAVARAALHGQAAAPAAHDTVDPSIASSAADKAADKAAASEAAAAAAATAGGTSGTASGTEAKSSSSAGGSGAAGNSGSPAKRAAMLGPSGSTVAVVPESASGSSSTTASATTPGIANSSGAARKNDDGSVDYARQTREWGVAAVSCALSALRCRTRPITAQALVAQLFVLLAADDGDAAIGRAFQRLAEPVDSGLWKPVLPQLLTSFSRPERPYVLGVVQKLARQVPQAVYYQLRTLYGELVHAAGQRAGGSASSGAHSTPTTGTGSASMGATTPATTPAATEESAASSPAAKRAKRAPGEDGEGAAGSDSARASAKAESAESAREAAAAAALVPTKDVVYMVRAKYSMLVTVLDRIIEEITARFKSGPEEELLRTTRVLLDECLKTAFSFTEADAVKLIDAKPPLPVRWEFLFQEEGREKGGVTRLP